VTGRPIGVELFVGDLERSIVFYEALGFTEVGRRWADGLIIGRGAAKITLQGDAHAVEGPHYFTPDIGRRPRGTGVEIVIQVEDVDALFATARAAGLDVVKAIQDREWPARDFRLADPDGYFLRITSPLRGE
jgi:catechol 2,3-dioxygenase-like lactoylglutathione lyase family enzyme